MELNDESINKNYRFLYIEPVNFVDFPLGGTLSFSKQIISEFKNEIALVGMVTEEGEPVGKWFIKPINGIKYKYFGIKRFKKKSHKPLIPIRLQTFIYLLYFLPSLRKLKCNITFTQSPQILFALSFFKWESICFCFAGVGNSIALSRYKYLRIFGKIYERILFRILKRKVSTILAAADQESINEAMKRTGDILTKDQIITFPTRFDPEIFYLMDKKNCRIQLNIPEDALVLLTTGRLSWIKGWELLIKSSLELYNSGFEKVMMIFIGEGEDRFKIEDYKKINADNIVQLKGKLSQSEIALYLNACDVFVMGSHIEGWPTSLIEALACHCPLVSTNVSGAKEIIYEGQNGFIVMDRDPVVFAQNIKKSLQLKNVNNFSLKHRDKYSVKFLKNDLERLWLSKL